MMVPMRLLVVLEHPKSVINIQKNGNSALPLAESMTLTLTNSFLIIQEGGGLVPDMIFVFGGVVTESSNANVPMESFSTPFLPFG